MNDGKPKGRRRQHEINRRNLENLQGVSRRTTETPRQQRQSERRGHAYRFSAEGARRGMWNERVNREASRRYDFRAYEAGRRASEEAAMNDGAGDYDLYDTYRSAMRSLNKPATRDGYKRWLNRDGSTGKIYYL